MGPQLVVISELLVAGLQGAAWVGFLVATLLGTDWIDRVRLGDWGIAVGVVGLAFVYGLGVIIDRVANELFDVPDESIRKAEGAGTDQTDVARWRLSIMQQEATFGVDLAYVRTKVRLARALTVNSILVTLFGLFFALVRTSAVSSARGIVLLVLAGLLGVAIALLSWWAWNRATHTQYKQLRQIHEVVFGPRKPTQA